MALNSMDRYEYAHETMRDQAPGAGQRAIASAVLIGLGGSGVQTISRVRAALRAARGDSDELSSVQFLGVDSVDLTGQVPPLPDGVELPPGDFFNVTRSPFNARDYASTQLQGNKSVREWLDPTYLAPFGLITDGMRRDRMLGRLAFHRVRSQLASQIQQKMFAAAAIDPEKTAAGGKPSSPGKVNVYIVASSSGGTGSAGFLETIYAIWEAADRSGYTPVIRAFIYPPTVFESAVLNMQGGGTTALAQKANAYAFFRELDHFCAKKEWRDRHPSDPSRSIEYYLDDASGLTQVADGELLKQVYVIDNTLRGVGTIDDVRDVYELAAEAIELFLTSNMGQALIGRSSMLGSEPLARPDAMFKPQRYCSLGIARVVFPGETLRHHLLFRYADWYLHNGVLFEPDGLRKSVHDSPVNPEITTFVENSVAAAKKYDQGDDVAAFDTMFLTIERQLKLKPTVEEAQRIINEVNSLKDPVLNEIKESMARKRPGLLHGALSSVEELALSGDQGGIAYGIEVLELVRKRLESARKVIIGDKDAAVRSADKLGQAVIEQRKKLEGAERRNVFARIGGNLDALVGRGESQKTIAKSLGTLIVAWAQSILDEQAYAEAAMTINQLCEQVVEMQAELHRARSFITDLADSAQRRSTQDELIGKDAGPAATTTLIPDVMPEVEDSDAARSLFDAIVAEYSNGLTDGDVATLVRDWTHSTGNRAYFSLGSADAVEQHEAERSFVGLLMQAADERALHTDANGERVPRLPTDLRAAAGTDDTILLNGIAGLVRQSQCVCWNVDTDVLDRDPYRSPGSATEITTAIAVCEQLADFVEQRTGGKVPIVTIEDPERIIALSCEWALPIHAYTRIEAWREPYESALANAARGLGAPPHIDMRFADELAELQPKSTL